MVISLSIVLGVLIALGTWEYLLHARSLKKVPLRIHVNGTRGKSSVTRLIAAGLRAGGIPNCAKTTGSRPRIILEDGSEHTVQRQGRANVIEQTRLFALAAKRQVRAVVVECMALNPRLQALSEDQLIRSSFGVITNARSDHLDVMGPTVEDVARALAGTIPTRGTLLTAETRPELLQIFNQKAALKKSTMIPVTPASEEITGQMMRRFGYVEHPENVALALKVCELVGVPREKALDGMIGGEPDVGVLRLAHLSFFAKEIDFVNAFAANDPDSTLAIWDLILRTFPDERERVIILHCRADRGQRSVQLGAILARMSRLTRVLLTGTGTRLALEAAYQKGLPFERLIPMEQARAEEIFERAVAQIQRTGLVFGMGNIGQGGEQINEYFQNRAVASHGIQPGA